MRYVNGVLCAILILFAIVQYNDPDSLLWIVIYGIPAIWAGIATARPAVLRQKLPAALMVFSAGLAVIGTVYTWPQTPGWWRQDVWWNDESAREGMGMMIVTLAMLIVLLTTWRGRSELPPAA